MFRLLGIVLGSAITIGGMLMVLGTPTIQLTSFENDQARFDAALDKIREKQPAAEKIADELLDTVEHVAMAARKTAGAEPPAESVVEPPQPPPETAAPAEAPAIPSLEPGTQAIDTTTYDPHWHDFWNPFRSEIAARGFVSQLEKVTGLDYRIVKVKAGVYQVGFAYEDDEERAFKLSQISAATGLDLPGQ